jgi:hypothetical protein
MKELAITQMIPAAWKSRLFDNRREPGCKRRFEAATPVRLFNGTHRSGNGLLPCGEY